ncbi:nuclear transcription factor Y subunit C-4-like [Mercurialis annua]|uniref:nuclear transcription factor Y subunit C-4-like n=1 Tax=Mercurialis annua TaxID=3986 RepID=UPI00215F73A1|nr:nuclear transcription factor Y subunit C-4-like [Mercurialis annua]
MRRGRAAMDLNKSIEFNPTSPQVHNFMSIPSSFMIPSHHPYKKVCQEACDQSLFLQLQRQNLDAFWNQQLIDIQNILAFKSQHQLPLARIKKIMKSKGEVKMISADTPILFSKACELFILELTLRSWLQTDQCKRRILQRCDIARAIRHDHTLDFLLHAVPYDDYQVEETENCGQYLPHNQVPFLIDINEDFIMTDDEISQQYMIRP